MLMGVVRRLAVIALVATGADVLVFYGFFASPAGGALPGGWFGPLIALQTIGATTALLTTASGVSAAIFALQARHRLWFWCLVLSLLPETYSGPLSQLLQIVMMQRGADNLQYNGPLQALYFIAFPALPALAALAYTFRFRQRQPVLQAPTVIAGDDSFELTISAIERPAQP